MFDYKKMLHVEDRITTRKLFTYLERLNQDAKILIDGREEIFIRTTENELIFDSFSKNFYLREFSKIKMDISEKAREIINKYFENQTDYNFISLKFTVEELLNMMSTTLSFSNPGIDNFIVVLGSSNKDWFINIDTDENVVMFTSKVPTDLYTFNKYQLTDDELRVLGGCSLSSRRINRIRFDLKVAFDFAPRAEDAFDLLLEKPESLMLFYTDMDAITLDREIMALKDFKELSDEVKELWLNPIIMDKARTTKHIKWLEKNFKGTEE